MRQKIATIIVTAMMMSVGITLIGSDNASAVFVESLSVPWTSDFTPMDSAWDSSGSNCIVVGDDTSGIQPSVWCYNETAGSWSAVFECTDPGITPINVIENTNTGSYYYTLQSAIDNATSGNVLDVWSGTYYERIYINKSLILRGNGSANTIINGNGLGDVVTIQADGVSLSGFTITGGGSLYTGIHLYKVEGCIIENNTVNGNNDGILVDGASNNMIRGNDIKNNAGVGVRTKESEETKTVVGLTDNGGATGYGLMFGMDTSDPQYEVMYDFEPNCLDGRCPSYCNKLIQDQVNPNYFFGTAPSGGKYNRGIIFRIDSTGTDYSILYEFRGYPTDGSGPTGELFQFGDVLYGTTTNGGSIDYGTMFRINRDGTGYAMLHTFTGGTNGYRPSYGGLAWDGSYFYGTTMYGGTIGNGCIYRINMDGTGYTYLYSFQAANGYYPYGTLSFDAAYLYGVARSGGVNYGTVYRILKDGSGFTVLHTFAAAADGRNPSAGLLLQGSVLYGTTFSGATGMTGGTAFRLNTDGTLYSILHSFTGTPDGSNTYGGLIMVGGMLYGMSNRGGTNNLGAIYTLSTDGLVYYRIHNFTATPMANSPYGLLTYDGTMLYGMTYYGGAFDDGAVFRIMPDGSGFQQLHDFDGTFYNGVIPSGHMTQVGNYLYGIASDGGIYNGGAVFRTALDGTGYTVLHYLQYSVEGGSFWNIDGLTNVGTRLYGISYEGGVYDNGGAIFSLNTDGTNPTVIETFNGAPGGQYGVGNLTWDGGSYLYGMTEAGGASGLGTIFRVEIATNNVDYLYSFIGVPEPRYPRGSLLDDGEFLYGISYSGGTNDRGTVFKIEKATSIVTVIHNFTTTPDLFYPTGTLVQDGIYLYGIANSGGTDSNGGIFRLRKDGSGYYIMHSFVYSESGYGTGHLAIDGSMLYGMAMEGATYGYGTVFRMNKDTMAFSTLHNFQSEEHYYTNLEIVTNYAMSSSNNIIYHNNFLGNTLQALNDDLPVNMWNDVYPTGGNYWSDYTGVDADSDGIIDTPLTIPDVAGAMDSYPWLRQNGWKMPYSAFRSVAWDNVNHRFWLCGGVSPDAQSTFYYIPASAPTTMVPIMAPPTNFTALAADNTGNVLIGGDDLQYIFYYDSRINNGYGLVENGTGAMYGWNITSITFNPYDQRFYFVGNVKDLDTGVAFFTDSLPLNSSGHKCYIDNSDFMNFPGIGGLKSIAWNPLRNYSIAVGDGVYRLNSWNGMPDRKLTWSTIKSPEAGTAYYDISWDIDGWNEAGIVGVNQTYGNYWRYYYTNPQLLQGNASAVAGTTYRTCAMKPPSSPKWLIIPYSSGGWRINIEEKYEGAQVTADAAGPAIFAMDFRSMGSEISKLDQQIDTDHTYTFYIDANNTAGAMDRWDFSLIEIWAWFDEGKLGGNSNASSISPTAPPANRTRQFAIIYNVTTKNATMLYPSGFPEEFALHSVWEDMTIYTDQRRHLMINVTFKMQTRAASGGISNSPPIGGNMWDKNYALNDMNSWDFNITLIDYTNKTVLNTTYGEFEVKKAVSVISSGNPTGAAAPGSISFLLSNPTLITYSANTPYYVNVSLKSHLMRNGIGPEMISVSNISVRNENTQSTNSNSDIPYSGAASSFTAPGEANAKCVWGISVPQTLIQAPNHGTVAVGPNDSDYNLIPPGSAFTLVNWWASIPAGTLQGTYWATITFTITYL